MFTNPSCTRAFPGRQLANRVDVKVITRLQITLDIFIFNVSDSYSEIMCCWFGSHEKKFLFIGDKMWTEYYLQQKYEFLMS